MQYIFIINCKIYNKKNQDKKQGNRQMTIAL